MSPNVSTNFPSCWLCQLKMKAAHNISLMFLDHANPPAASTTGNNIWGNIETNAPTKFGCRLVCDWRSTQRYPSFYTRLQSNRWSFWKAKPVDRLMEQRRYYYIGRHCFNWKQFNYVGNNTSCKVFKHCRWHNYIDLFGNFYKLHCGIKSDMKLPYITAELTAAIV